MNEPSTCRLAIVTGPSGAGKSHVRHTLAADPSLDDTVFIDFDTVLPMATVRAFPFFRSWYDSEWSIWKAISQAETWTDRGERIDHCPMDVVTPFRLAMEQLSDVTGTHIYETDAARRTAGSHRLRTSGRVLVDGSQLTDGWMRGVVARVFESFHETVETRLFVVRPSADRLSKQRTGRGNASVDGGRSDRDASEQSLRAYDSWLSGQGVGVGYDDRSIVESSDEAVGKVRDWWLSRG